MRRTAGLAVFTLLSVALPATAASADTTISASTFATSPNFCGSTSQPVTLRGQIEVKGGTGTVTADCTITLTDGARLRFTNVTLTFTTSLQIGGGASSRLEVNGSKISTGSRLVLGPGSSFTSTPGAPGGSLKVDASQLTGSNGVFLLTSCNANNGMVEVTNSTLRSQGTDIDVAASSEPCGSERLGGQLTLRGNTIDANGAINPVLHTSEFISASDRTEVRDNHFNPADVVFVHGGNECRSENNTPASPCS